MAARVVQRQYHVSLMECGSSMLCAGNLKEWSCVEVFLTSLCLHVIER